MIRIRDLQLLRGSRALLDGAGLAVNPGEKVGLVGSNGSGKSSLFALLRGELHADRGDVEIPADWRIASVDQETPALARSALEHTLDGDVEFRSVQAELAAADHLSGEQLSGEQLAELHHRFEALDGYGVEARAAQMLAGLGFDSEAQQRPVASFSGGWRMRVNLARALIKPSELLLLDEPTNHLDLDAILWLERWLSRYPGTLVVISHDREFLDRLVDVIVHVEHGTLTTYRGDYSAFERQRGERLMQQQAIFEKQVRQRSHLQSYIDRFRYQATRARQAQSRIKALERLQAVAPLQAASGFDFAFLEPARLCSPLLSLNEVQAGYGDTPVLEHIHLNLLPGSRIGLLGRNGAGKSTLVKLLAEEIAPLRGQIEHGRNLVVGYFAQQQLEVLDLRASALLHLQRLAPRAREQELRDYLGGFGFRGEGVTAPVAPFSGGEKTRLALALLIWQRPNLLLLDEPTNHLDMEMREALVLALQDFTGAVVVVSHDRHLLRTVVDELYLVQDGAVSPFAGDLDDYQQLQQQSQRQQGQKKQGQKEQGQKRSGQKPQGETNGGHRTQDRVAAAPSPPLSAMPPAPQMPFGDRQARKREAAAHRQRTAEQRRRVAQAEQRFEATRARLAHIAEQLADAELYQPAAAPRLRQLLADEATLKGELESLEHVWLEALECLETVDAQFSEAQQ